MKQIERDAEASPVPRRERIGRTLLADAQDDPEPPEQQAAPALGVLRPITLDDQPVFERALSLVADPTSDSTFASVWGWADSLSLSWAEIEGHLCVFSAADGDLTMSLPPMPLGAAASERLAPCLSVCFAIMDEANATVGRERSRVESVSDEALDRVRRFEASPLSAGPMPGDYVYPRQAMVDLAGGALKSKRRLRNLFEREHPDAVLGPIAPADVPECVALLGVWREAGDVDHEGEVNERLIGTDVLRERDHSYTVRLLHQIERLGLESMTVRVGGRLVGFTIGERVNARTGMVHVEKTDPRVPGTPQFIFSKFCERCFEGASEINVGDDWGIASLRQTKLSYRPSRMVSKSILSRQPVAEVGSVEAMTVNALEAWPPASAPARSASPLTGVTLRRARRADAEAMIGVEGRCFPPDDRFTVRQIRRLIANPRAVTLVAEHEGEVAAWSVALVRVHRRWRSGRVYSVAVDPACAGRGLGRALLTALIGELSGQGVHRTYLEVREDNERAIGLYRSMGFETARRLRDYYGQGEHGLRMRRVVAPVVAG